MAADLPPPIVPQPHGWQKPGFLPPNVPRRLRVPWGVLGAGLLTGVVAAIAGWYLVTLAWNACESEFGLTRSADLFLRLGLMVVSGWLAFFVGCILIRPRSALAHWAAGTLFAVATVLVIVTANVPRSDPANYRSIDTEEHPECRLNGVPTWWPVWLPS